MARRGNQFNYVEGLLRFNMSRLEWDEVHPNIKDLVKGLLERFLDERFSSWKMTLECGHQEGLMHIQMGGKLKQRQRFATLARRWKDHVVQETRALHHLRWHEENDPWDTDFPIREIGWVRMRRAPNANGRFPGRKDIDHFFDDYLEDDTKVEGWGEGGERPPRNTTSSKAYNAAIALADEGVRLDDAIVHEDHGCMVAKYQGAYTRRQMRVDLLRTPIMRTITGVWIHGSAGTGKSHAVNLALVRVLSQLNREVGMGPGATAWPDLLYEFALERHGWEDGYRGQPVGLMDEFGPGSIQLKKLNRMMDSRPCSIAQRHSAGAMLNMRMLIVVSNYTPADCWPGVFLKHPELEETVNRRFTLITLEKDPLTNQRDPAQQESLISLLYLLMMRAHFEINN